jgi:hypothetical protein
MKLDDAISVVESVAGFTDETTSAGEAWAVIRAALAQPEPPAEGEVGELLQAALASFKLTQDPANYPADHWSRRATELLDRSRRAQPVRVGDEKGLYGKYIIHRSRDGSPVDYPCFVLRLDGSDPAAMAAMRAYAEDPACPPELAGDLAVYCAIPAPVLPADGEVAELVDWLREEVADAQGEDCPIVAAKFACAADLLERQAGPVPVPVPVSERPWEREGWVNGDDECWIGYPSTTYAIADTGDYDTTAYEWRLEAPPSRPEVSNCVALPAHALPLPTPPSENV